jgi:hypothetical protein
LDSQSAAREDVLFISIPSFKLLDKDLMRDRFVEKGDKKEDRKKKKKD